MNVPYSSVMLGVSESKRLSCSGFWGVSYEKERDLHVYDLCTTFVTSLNILFCLHIAFSYNFGTNV